MPLALALLAASQVGSFAGTTAVWDGMLHVPIRCELTSGSCAGDMTVSAPGETAVLAESSYSVPAGATRSVLVDPGGSASQRIIKLAKVDVRLSTREGTQAEATLRVIHRSSGSRPAPSVPTHEVLSVTDRRGDGVRRLDLRRVTVRVRRGRLILRFYCWRRFGPADMDHNVGHFSARVQLHANDPPRESYGIGFFFAHGNPFAQAGKTLFPNHRVRYSRPDGRSIQLSIPVSAFGHPKRLWISPSAGGYEVRREDRAPRLNVRV